MRKHVSLLTRTVGLHDVCGFPLAHSFDGEATASTKSLNTAAIVVQERIPCQACSFLWEAVASCFLGKSGDEKLAHGVIWLPYSQCHQAQPQPSPSRCG